MSLPKDFTIISMVVTLKIEPFGLFVESKNAADAVPSGIIPCRLYEGKLTVVHVFSVQNKNFHSGLILLTVSTSSYV